MKKHFVALALIALAGTALAHGDHSMNTKINSGAKLDHTIGQAVVNWATNTCNVDVDPKGTSKHMTVTWGAEFVLKHEMAHCHLYQNPNMPWKQAGYKGKAKSQLLDELLAAESVHNDLDRFSYYNIVHEAFADTVALLQMYKKGYSKETLSYIPKWRDAAAFDPEHNVAKVFKMMNWGAKDFNAEAKLVAAKFLLSNPGHAQYLQTADDKVVARDTAGKWCLWARSITKLPYQDPMLGFVYDSAFETLVAPTMVLQMAKNKAVTDKCEAQVQAALLAKY